MTRLPLIAIAAAAAMIIAVLVVHAPRLAHARRAAEREVARFHQVSTDARELVTLRSAHAARHGSSAAPDAPPPKLSPAITAALASSGLPAQTLASLSPESATRERIEGGGSGIAAQAPAASIIRRRATLVLTPLTLPQLGRFLDIWRKQAVPDSRGSAGEPWTVSRIDVEPRRDGQPTPGADLPLRATLVMESVSLEADMATDQSR